MQLGGPGATPEGGGEDAWALFSDRRAIEAAMTSRFLGHA